jgi:predicted SAM-dependent methyltransferase
MKLNLGSGKFLLKGYVNVDIVKSEREGRTTDLVCDLLQLPFEDNTADGILLLHVLEHFTYEDAVRLLGKLGKLLKAGSKLMIETPDIRKVINNFSDHESMKVVYGHLSDHKWGWTPESLKKEMSALNFKILDIRDGYFHKHPERDVLVIATK